MSSTGQDNDARQVLEHFTSSMDGARDKLNKEEQRLATAAQEGAVLKRSVRVLAEQRGALTAALATLEAETARLDQHAERRRAHYAAVDGALEAIQSKKRAADGELQSTVDRVAAARAAFVRRGLEGLLGMLDEYSPDTVRAAVDARRQELAMLHAQLATARTAVRPQTSAAVDDVLYAEATARYAAATEEVRTAVAARAAVLSDLTRRRDGLRQDLRALRDDGAAMELRAEEARAAVARLVDGMGPCTGCGGCLGSGDGDGDGESGHVAP